MGLYSARLKPCPSGLAARMKLPDLLISITAEAIPL
jgi:hypothetical protein